ncbi:MAG: FixH family protein [Myxococcaceae bacterium]|jgi:hypothetical protein|nr:FixH family protein [Myxococcaceae bacterium]
MSRCSLLLTLPLILVACGHAHQEPAGPTRTTLAQVTSDGLAAELSSTAALSTGLSTVWLTLSENGQLVTDATVTLLPEMTMPDRKHACPVVGDVTHEGLGIYRGQLVFQMPSGDTGTWSLAAKVVRGGRETLVRFDSLAIGDSGLSRSFTVANAAMPTMPTRYVMSVSFPEGKKVGLNPVVVTLHRMKDMMTFPAVDDATVEMVPEMPAHGHGSPNNVAPASKGAGRYEGVVNFTMPGEWKTTFTVSSAGSVMQTFAIDLML